LYQQYDRNYFSLPLFYINKRKEVMKKILFLTVFILIGSLSFFSCPTDDNGDDIPSVYKEFYNYPAGRVNSDGLLMITNDTASPMLLFHSQFTPSSYIGTVGGSASVNVQLPAVKFYSIIAVDKADYEANGVQASQCYRFAFYSDTPNIIVSSYGLTSGDRQWVLNNNTSYWVKVEDIINNNIYAILAPMQQMVTLPLSRGQYLSYTPVFMKELKYNGRTIALVEFADSAQSNTVSVDNNAVYTTTFNSPNAPAYNLHPAVVINNNSGRTLRIYKTKDVQLNNGADDFTIGSGVQGLVTGFYENDDTADIYFWTAAWLNNGQDGFKQVSHSEIMQNNKVYQITVSDDGNTITVEVKDASEVYE
jgi:hypothetical protein